MAFKLDLSKFKKVRSDKDTTTLRHYEGHEIRLAHKALSKDTRNAVAKLKMAEGGEVSDKNASKAPVDKGPAIDPQKAKEIQTGATDSGWRPQEWKKNLKEGLGFAEGGEVENEVQDLATEPTPTEDAPIPVGQLPMTPQPGASMQLAQDPRALPQTDSSEAAMPTDSQPQTAPQAVAPEQPTAPMDPNAPTFENAYKLGTQGNKMEADAMSGAADKQAAIEHKAAQADQIFMAKRQSDYDQMAKETLAQAHDIANKKIDANDYWKDHSKVTSAIAVFLGAFAPGGHNAALDYINKAIARNVDDQKSNSNKQNNLLNMNMKIYGNKVAAEDATRATNAAYVAHQMGEVAAKSNSQVVKARALQGQAQLMQQYAPLVQKAATIKTLQGPEAAHLDPSNFINQIVKPDQQKAVAGEIQAAQDTKRMSKEILSSFEEATKENTIAKTGFGLLRTPGSVYALHQAMQPTFKDLEGTVRQAAMDNTFKNITPAPGDSEHKIEQKRQALMGYLQSKASAPIAKANGLDLSKFDSTRPITMEESAASRPETREVNGATWQKVANGWRKVK